MGVNKKDESKVAKVFRYIFYMSLLYEAAAAIFIVASAFIGVDSGWAMPAMSSGEKDYGLMAMINAFGICLAYTFEMWPLLCVPVYQVIYLIIRIISNITTAIHNKDNTEKSK